MNHGWPHQLRRLARALGWIVGVSLVALAVLVAAAQITLPLLARHPQWVAAQLADRLHRPVQVASMEGHWQPSGPLFVLHDVTIGAAQGGTPMRLPESQLKLDLGGWLMPSRHLLNLHVRGLQLDLSHEVDGSWHVNGIGVAGGNRAQRAQRAQKVSLGPLSVELWLRDLHLEIADAAAGRHYSLIAEQLRLSRHGGRIRVGMALRREGAAGRWHGAGLFREDGSSGRMWLAADDMNVRALFGDVAMDGYTAERGHGSVAAWLDWRGGRVVRGTLRYDLADLAVAGPAGGARVPTMHGMAGFARQKDGFQLRLLADDGGVLVASVHQPDTAAMQVSAAAHDLQLAPLLPWLAMKPDLSPALAQWLGGGGARATLPHAALRWNRSSGLQSLDLAFAGLGIDPVGKLPGVDGLRGELRGDAQALSLELPRQASVLRFPHLFRRPFSMADLSGNLAFWHADEAWHIGADALDFEGQQFAGQARGEMALPDGGGRPFLDLYAKIDHADVQAAKLFWPIGSMSPAAIAWLDRALVAGTVTDGEALVRGSLADWPFRHNEGRFEARTQLRGLDLDYGNRWPRAQGVSAVASFVNNGLLVEADGGEALGNKLTHAVALIPDFSDSVLDLNAQGAGTGESLLDFASKSPIAERQAETVAKLSLGGTGDFDFHLSLPLKDVSALALQGQAQLHDADLQAPAWKLKLDRLNGPLRFDSHGLDAGPLDVGFRGQPSRLTLKVAAATGDPNKLLSASLTGNYRFAELVQDLPALRWLGDVAQGRSPFSIGFDISRAGNGSEALNQALVVDSSLQGMALDLPVPLKKAVGAALPLHLSLPLPVDGADLQLAMGQVLRARFRLPGGDSAPLAGTLALGTQMPDTVPARGLRIRGHAPIMDINGWVQRSVAITGSSASGTAVANTGTVASASSSPVVPASASASSRPRPKPGPDTGSSTSLESIDVSADKALLFGKAFDAMHIVASPQPSNSLAIDVTSKGLVGHFDVPSADLAKRGITARLQQLYWPKDPTPPKASGGPAEAAPASTASSANASPPSNPAATGINPASLPPFHLWISDLRLGDARLGEARLETWPTAKGMHIDQLRALSKRVQISASGAWNGDAQDSHTHLRMDFTAENLGSMLNAFGFAGLFEGGQTRARLDASWPGAPSALALANLDGTLNVDVSRGRIPDVGPGVGRLFGLISVAELPRRLTLDFGDVFGKGLGFDAITGDFRFADGNATTSNLKIAGPAAEISITGRTGLRSKDYDQQILVVPHLGNSLPIVGAVVGGPVGAAAGFAVQGLLGRGLNKAAGARYRISGPWAKPTITLLEKHAAATAPESSATTAAPAAASSATR